MTEIKSLNNEELLKFGTQTVGQMDLLIEGLAICRSYIKPQSIADFMGLVQETNNLFFLGIGRSGLASKMGGMRTIQIEIPGKNIYIAGETTTPAAKPNDLVVVVSSSGESASNLAMRYKARGAKLALLGSHKASSIGAIAEVFVHLPDKNQILIDNPEFAIKVKKQKNWALLGTITEICTILFLDAFLSEWTSAIGKSESDLQRVHQIEA